jgi:hypothetical protein
MIDQPFSDRSAHHARRYHGNDRIHARSPVPIAEANLLTSPRVGKPLGSDLGKQRRFGFASAMPSTAVPFNVRQSLARQYY